VVWLGEVAVLALSCLPLNSLSWHDVSSAADVVPLPDTPDDDEDHGVWIFVLCICKSLTLACLLNRLITSFPAVLWVSMMVGYLKGYTSGEAASASAASQL
jgi:hypothetical protein